MGTLTRPLAVVTGASSGIGFELARQFAEHGFDLIVAADGSGIIGAAERLRGLGAAVEPVQADLGTAIGCDRLVRVAEGLEKPIEAIALNAGVGVGGRFASETSLEDELAMIDLNVVSTVRLAKWALQDMVARGRGRVLFTASIAGIMPTPLEAVYGATKSFVLAFAAALRYELEGSGVTITALLPGPTDTEFFERAGLAGTRVAEVAKKNDPAEVARQGFEAMMAGRDRIAAGNFSVKAQGALARFLPESLKAAQHRRMSEHGSARKQ